MIKYKKFQKIRLGVNIDHIATLRQVRGDTTPYPNIHKFAILAMKSGAEQITIHLREDRRHIQLKDLIMLSKDKKVKINLEMAATDEMFELALKYKPAWVCLVPEKRQELTTEGGLNVSTVESQLQKWIPRLHKKNIKVSLFIAPQAEMIELTKTLNADAVEFHTGHWVSEVSKIKKQKFWKELYNGAILANELKLNVHAGHGLDYEHAAIIKTLPYLQELNIGHSLICYSIELGIKKAIQKMCQILK